ncbi:DUF2785 domain-containing protein [Loigolactobacillus backii]|nr:DUF2785 domain-containing protein [Loigolactobacillus backii]MDA5387631.1 DUF2785 domain-containing protein [Loigolactobacillus backii]MDA5390123.1 DUF2785 domain-containing protein [Loigolactobacillus backii]
MLEWKHVYERSVVMTSQAVTNTKQALVKLREQLRTGELYQHLPEKIDQIINQLPHEKRTPVILPEDDAKATTKLLTLSDQIKNKEKRTITDKDLEFMLAHLGSTNPTVRDRGVYFLFHDLIEMKILTTDQLKHVLDRVLEPSMLYEHILEAQGNGAFLRSFSVMLLSLVLYADRTHYHFIETAQLEEISLAITTYIVLETDCRGYAGNKGWVHAYSHIGNVLDELTASTKLSRADKIFYLAALVERYKHLNKPLVFGEDYRLAAVIANLVNKHKIYADYLTLLLHKWQQQLMAQQPKADEVFWNRWYNRNRLLEALLIRGDLPDKLQQYILRLADFY